MTVELDPEIAAGIAHLFDATWAQVMRGEVRGAPAAPRVDDADVVVRDDRLPDGDVPIRWYLPSGVTDALRPALVWSHGGGWQYGNLDMPEAHNVAQRLARTLGIVVASVGYRLAPGHRHPVGRDDIVASFGHVVDRADSLGIDPTRIAVGGASAGAHLTALATVALVAAGTGPVAQFLAYPVVDPVAGRYERRADCCPEVLWLDRDSVVGLFRAYLPEDVDVDLVGADPRFTPAAADLVDLPPTLVTTAAADGLTAQAVDFVDALRAAGVEVTHHAVEGTVHGYLNLVGGPRCADRALDRHAAWLGPVLARP